MTLPDGRVIAYVHDPLGRRLAKKVNGSVVEKYLWEGLTRLLAVYDGSDSLLMRFEYADARMPFAMTMGGVFYLAYDQVGSLRVVADGSGNPVKRIDYDSFGNIITETDPTMKIPFGFAGGLHDRDTGLVRFGYRDYDPDTGRWTAKDPIGFGGGDADLYGYCLDDPVNWTDPTGEIAVADDMVFWTGIAVIVGYSIWVNQDRPFLESRKKGKELIPVNPDGTFDEGSSDPCGDPPPEKDCNTATKLLEQYERLAKKYNLNLGHKRFNALNALRDSGRIKVSDLPKTLRDKFPKRFQNDDLNSIYRKCGKKQ